MPITRLRPTVIVVSMRAGSLLRLRYVRWMWRLVATVVLLRGIARADDPPTVRVNDAADTLATAIAKLDGKAKAGATFVVANIAKPDPKPNEAPVPRALRATLAKHKLTILDEREDSGTLTLTIEAANGARARVGVGPQGGIILLTPKPAATKAPGACVAIPEAKHPVFVNSMGISSDGEMFDGQTFWDYKTSRIHDVDGDGIADAFVPIAKTKHACPEQVSFRVFVVRGACGHDVGVVGPGSFAWDAGAVALDASGFRPFAMTAESSKHGKRGLPEMTTTTRQFRFDNGKYKQTDSKTRTGICHHCAVWHCTGKE